MDDVISRQAVIAALGERPIVWAGSDYGFGARNQYDKDLLAIETVPPAQPEVDRMPLVVEAVNTLINSAGDSPSAKALRNAGKFVKNAIDGELPTFEEITLEEPERKRGRWIYGEDNPGTGRDGWFCSECGHFEMWDYSADMKSAELNLPNYCPNCGADMQEVDDERPD